MLLTLTLTYSPGVGIVTVLPSSLEREQNGKITLWLPSVRPFKSLTDRLLVYREDHR